MSHVCLFVFFLLRMVLQKDQYLQPDIADFLPCLPILHHTRSHRTTECLKMGTKSKYVNLGSTEQAEFHAELSIGVGVMRKQNRLHFNVFIWSKGWEICPISIDTQIFNIPLAGTGLVFCTTDVRMFCANHPSNVPSTPPDFSTDSSATLPEKGQKLAKRLAEGDVLNQAPLQCSFNSSRLSIDSNATLPETAQKLAKGLVEWEQRSPGMFKLTKSATSQECRNNLK